jgi:very-short-patch-repair endonuclease
MDTKMPPSDELLGNIVMFLLEGDEQDAVDLLLSCDLEFWPDHNEETDYVGWNVRFHGPRAAVDILNGYSATQLAVWNATHEVLKAYNAGLSTGSCVIRLNNFDPNWREEVRGIRQGNDVHNQGMGTEPQNLRTWHNLRFRSESEVRIAQALERAGVLFLPNCKARLNTPEGRRTKEADFLICYDGKWGVLEVDGAPYHPPTRTVQDHQRDRLFRAYGIRVVEHFDASECYESPDAVVQRFLEILRQS